MNYSVAALALFFVATSSAAEFDEIVHNPSKYHHHTITVMGVARVEGLTFELYANPADANSYASPDKALSISLDVEGPRYDRYDNRWVKITGVVDAKRHGMWGYSCIVFAKSVQLLPVPPAGPPHVVISGVFRNEGPQDVTMVLLDQRGKLYAEFPVPRHESNGTGIRKGAAEVRDASGRVIGRYDLLLSDQDAAYFEASSHTYYYRITNGQVIGMNPEETKRVKPRK